MRREPRLLTAAAALLLMGALLSASQQPSPRGTAVPPVLTESLAGSDSFALYCASCHGSSGRGDGPAAPALRNRPADLTALARRNGGSYPAERVNAIVIGTARPEPAHGSSEMPVWGPLFRAFESDARVRARVESLVAHIGTLQMPSTAPGDAGSVLFRTYCASCHGSDARGSGPVAAQMRRLPPDLTQFAARNGGTFPSERLRRIVDGRDVAAHGDRDMPVWGDAFRRSTNGLSEREVQERIGAIVGYLERIQERPAE
jgi:mono/diheme cytochrome c family protein